MSNPTLCQWLNISQMGYPAAVEGTCCLIGSVMMWQFGGARASGADPVTSLPADYSLSHKQYPDPLTFQIVFLLPPKSLRDVFFYKGLFLRNNVDFFRIKDVAFS